MQMERVIPHPVEEQFTVFERVPASTTASSPSTRVLVFQPISSNPISVRTLPFQLRNVVAVPPTGFFPTDPSGFTLVGITESWSVVVFGDDVQLPEEEGASARAIKQEAAPTKRTLFQDIFGDIAFADISAAPGPSRAPDTMQPWKGKEVTEIFNAPAHLMPPLEYLFDSVMDGFLAARTVEEEDAFDSKQGEDDEMDVDEADDDAGAPARSAPLDRVVDRQEMSGFVELFAQHAIKGTPAPRRSVSPRPPTSELFAATSSNHPPHVNGAHRPNGVAPHVNGAHAAPPTPKATPKANGVLPNGHAYTPSRPPTSADPSPAKAGKKRKKSLG